MCNNSSDRDIKGKYLYLKEQERRPAMVFPVCSGERLGAAIDWINENTHVEKGL